MRVAAAVAFLLASTLSSRAATFVQELPANQSLAEAGPYDIRGQYFDPRLGTLTGVNALLTGSYVTSIFGVRTIAAREIPTTIVYSLNSFGPGNDFTGVAGTQFAFLGQGGLTGGEFPFGLAIVFPNLTEFVGPPGIQYGPQGPQGPTLGNFSIYARISPGLITSTDGALSDDSHFSGTFELTYTYDVPEPAATGLFCLGLLSLGLMRWRIVSNR